MVCETLRDDELMHYGVLGMKWGVRRALHKTSSNEKLREKALKYDKKATAFRKKSEKIHAKEDLERSNRVATKAAKYNKKAIVARKKSLNETNEFKKTLLERKAAKLEYKSAKKQITANRISKTTGYSMKAMKYSIKSDKVTAKAAKTRMKLANNEAYIAKTKRKINSLSADELRNGYEFVKRLSD